MVSNFLDEEMAVNVIYNVKDKEFPVKIELSLEEAKALAEALNSVAADCTGRRMQGVGNNSIHYVTRGMYLCGGGSPL